ncbi:hypothetical protein QYF36_018474 [Acer negundo]|nr:hypothetical protein QYF36_018474 [Acer negundo]
MDISKDPDHVSLSASPMKVVKSVPMIRLGHVKVVDKANKGCRKQNLLKDLRLTVSCHKVSQLVVEMESIVNKEADDSVGEMEGNTNKDNEVTCSNLMEVLGHFGGVSNTKGKSSSFKGAMHVNSVEKSGGLLLFWSEDIDVSFMSLSKGHVDMKIDREGKPPWRFSGFYENPNRSVRKDIWELLKRLSRVDDLPWLCVGAKVQHLRFNSSDHHSLLLEFEEGFRGDLAGGERPFKFEPFWLKVEDCTSVVNEAWSNGGPVSSMDDLHGKLSKCVSHLKGWRLIKFGSLKKGLPSMEVAEVLALHHELSVAWVKVDAVNVAA